MVGALLVGFSCTGRDTQPDKPVIGVSLLTLTNPFFRDLGNAIKQEAERQGYEVVLTAGDLDIGKQKNQVSDFIVQDVAAKLAVGERCPLDGILLKYLVNINGRQRFLLTE